MDLYKVQELIAVCEDLAPLINLEVTDRFDSGPYVRTLSLVLGNKPKKATLFKVSPEFLAGTGSFWNIVPGRIWSLSNHADSTLLFHTIGPKDVPARNPTTSFFPALRQLQNLLSSRGSW